MTIIFVTYKSLFIINRTKIINLAKYSTDSKNFRNVLSPHDLTEKDIKQLFHTVEKLKNGEKANSLQGKAAIYLASKCSIKAEVGIARGMQHIGMFITTVHDKKMTQRKRQIQDLSRLLSRTHDIIFCKLSTHVRTRKLATLSDVPIVNMENCRYAIPQALADLYTLQEHFTNLDKKKLAWLGPTGPLISSYLTMAPKLGMQVNYYCMCSSGERMSPACLDDALRECSNKDLIRECSTREEATKGADVISTKGHFVKDFSIDKLDVKKANKGWVFLHPLPRYGEVDEDIFDAPNNMCWKSFANYPWICAAIVLHCFKYNKEASFVAQ